MRAWRRAPLGNPGAREKFLLTPASSSLRTPASRLARRNALLQVPVAVVFADFYFPLAIATYSTSEQPRVQLSLCGFFTETTGA
jgi:hypothetical protein